MRYVPVCYQLKPSKASCAPLLALMYCSHQSSHSVKVELRREYSRDGMSVPLHFCRAERAEFKFLNLHALLTPFGIHSRKLGLQNLRQCRCHGIFLLHYMPPRVLSLQVMVGWSSRQGCITFCIAARIKKYNEHAKSLPALHTSTQP